MLFKKTIKRALSERGYKHSYSDDKLSVHGEYARHMQYAFSKEFVCGHDKVVDVVFLGADMHAESIVIGFFRENVSVEAGKIENGSVHIPLAKFSVEEFEKQIDKLIPEKVHTSCEMHGKEAF